MHEHKVKRRNMQPGDPISFFGYLYVEDLPFEQLQTKYAEHRRLKTFAKKGCQCAVPGCTRAGTRLVVGVQRNGSRHVDLYTEDMHPMTVDHIVPRSLGGPDHLDNYQPMCFQHNNKKGNKIEANETIKETLPSR